MAQKDKPKSALDKFIKGIYQCRVGMSISTYQLGSGIKVFSIWTLGMNMNIQILLKKDISHMFM